MNEEIWKAIPSLPNYEASSHGRVRNIKTGTIRKNQLKKESGREYLGFKKKILVHHLVAEAFHGKRPEGMVVDHIDRNRRNNHSSNLRYATPTQNNWNTMHRVKFRGVSQDARPNKGKRWRAALRINKKTVWLGRFDTPEEAAICHDIECIKQRGDFAVLNFPDFLREGVYVVPSLAI